MYIYIHHEGPAKSHNATPIFIWGSSPNSDLQVALWTLQNCAVSDKNIQNARPCCAEPRWCTGYCDLAAMTVDEWMHVTSRIVVGQFNLNTLAHPKQKLSEETTRRDVNNDSVVVGVCFWPTAIFCAPLDVPSVDLYVFLTTKSWTHAPQPIKKSHSNQRCPF